VMEIAVMKNILETHAFGPVKALTSLRTPGMLVFPSTSLTISFQSKKVITSQQRQCKTLTSENNIICVLL
jgi:hypothetical protein